MSDNGEGLRLPVAAFAVHGDSLLQWTPAGYRPQWHPSAGDRA
jgi:hypothetical protein